MSTGTLSLSDQRLLLQWARQALEAAAQGRPPPVINVAALPPALQQPGTSFVTLTRDDELRGCIGGLLATQALCADICQHTAQAALDDPRFPPVTTAELPRIEIEISVLTAPQHLEYDSPAHLPQRLRPNLDGVILAHKGRRATFLPQVWEKVPNPETFLSMLCEKMGLPGHTWRHTPLEVKTYQVEKFTEKEMTR